MRNERIDSTWQPAPASAVAAALGGGPHFRLHREPDAHVGQEADAHALRRRSARSAAKPQSWDGRLMKSRASGRAITLISSAASATLRVIGPVTRPR